LVRSVRPAGLPDADTTLDLVVGVRRGRPAREELSDAASDAPEDVRTPHRHAASLPAFLLS